jgi:hypothetical protein
MGTLRTVIFAGAAAVGGSGVGAEAAAGVGSSAKTQQVNITDTIKNAITIEKISFERELEIMLTSI